MCTNVFSSSYLQFFGSTNPEVELLDHGVIVFNFLRNRHAVFHDGFPILRSYRTAHGFQFFHLLTNTYHFLFYFILFFCNSHPHGWGAVACCDFDWHSPKDCWCWTPLCLYFCTEYRFHVLIGHCRSLEKCLFNSKLFQPFVLYLLLFASKYYSYSAISCFSGW